MHKPTSGLTPCGVRRMSQPTNAIIPAPESAGSGLTAATLSTSQRKNLPKSAFVFPDRAPSSGSYPLVDREHAADALARSKGTKDEAAVKRAVCSKYPDMPACSV